MSPSIWQILIVLLVVLILFGGGGKISRLMGDVGKGIRSLREGLKGEDEPEETKKVTSDKDKS